MKDNPIDRYKAVASEALERQRSGLQVVDAVDHLNDVARQARLDARDAAHEALKDRSATIHGWSRPQYRAAFKHVVALGNDPGIRFEDSSPTRLASIQAAFRSTKPNADLDPLSYEDGATTSGTASINAMFDDAMFLALNMGLVDKKVPRGTTNEEKPR